MNPGEVEWFEIAEESKYYLNMHPLRVTRKRLSKKTSERVIHAVIRRLKSAISPEGVILFGSAGRGEMTDQSDIDLLILAKDIESISALRKQLRPYRPLSKFPVDIIWMSIGDFNLKKEIGGVAFIANEEGRWIIGNKIND